MASKHTVVIFGEVLFDVFEHEQEVLGGAPFNVAWNLNGFGQPPLFISRIGEDERGQQILSAMERVQMSRDGLQTDKHLPTGIVSVTTEDGEPSFNIHSGMAYDFINSAEAQESVGDKKIDLLYHGSLALRSEVSRKSLDHIKPQAGSATFFDVNLRDPWWKESMLIDQIEQATWVKCNENELMVIAGILHLKDKDLEGTSRQVLNHFNLKLLAVTRGGDGAIAIDEAGNTAEAPPAKIQNMVDTVGAGDAFSSVIIIGLLNDWPLQTMIRRANQFAAKICQIQGATTSDTQLYQNTIKEWEN